MSAVANFTTSSFLPVEYNAEYLSLTAITILQDYDSSTSIRIPHVVTGYPAGRLLGLSSQFYLSVAADLSVFVSVLCSSALSNRNALSIAGCLLMLLFTLLVIGMGAVADFRAGLLDCKRRIKERLREERKYGELAEKEQADDDDADDEDEEMESMDDSDEIAHEECLSSPRPITNCNSYSGSTASIFGVNSFNWYSLGFDDLHDIRHCYRHLTPLLERIYHSTSGFLGLMYNTSSASISVMWTDQMPDIDTLINTQMVYIPNDWNYTWVNTEFKNIDLYDTDIYQDIYRIFTNGTSLFADRSEQRFCFCNSIDNQEFFSRNVLIDMSFGFDNSFIPSPCSIEDCIG